MPADPETLSALQGISDRLESKMDRAQEKGEEQARRLYSKIDDVKETTQSGLTDLGLKLQETTTELREHKKRDDEEFARVDAAIKEGSKDRRGLWQLLGAGSVSGGIVAAIIQALTGKTP